MDSSGVYRIINNITNDFYIGSAKNLSGRRAVHFSQLLNNKHPNFYLQRVVNKYGIKNLTFEILIICDKTTTKIYEQLFIDKLNPRYNLSPNAFGGDGSAFTRESRIKGGISRRGVPKPASYSEKLSKRMLGNKLMLGKKHSEESKKKMSLAQVGNKKFLGKKHTEEYKKYMCELMKGRIFSSETKQKMSKSRKIYWARLKAEKEGRNDG